MKNKRIHEKGSVEVEATFILPLVIIFAVLLIYLSLFMFQKACLQGSLETAVIYYKSSITDSFITENEKMEYISEDTQRIGSGNSYKAVDVESPFAGMFEGITKKSKSKNESKFRNYVGTILGKALVGSEPQITYKYINGLVSDQIEATATQTVTFPIDLSFIGAKNEYQISAFARVAVVDSDGLINNVDFVIDVLTDTKLKELADDFKGKIGEAYQKVKDILS